MSATNHKFNQYNGKAYQDGRARRGRKIIEELRSTIESNCRYHATCRFTRPAAAEGCDATKRSVRLGTKG